MAVRHQECGAIGGPEGPVPSTKGAAPGACPSPSDHPEDLSRADRPYLVPWGRREMLVAASGAAALVGGLVLLSILAHPLWAVGLIPVLGAAAFFILFFRNPSRIVPDAPGLLVSPADGTVWDISVVDEKEFVGEPCIRIGIFLSVFNVHVNRAPVSGSVEWVLHREGAYHDARSSRAAIENESNSIGMVRDDTGGPAGLRILVKQISGAIARRIICPLRPPVRVARGGLVGMIKYGSRTEVYIPQRSGACLQVGVGTKVKGGSTVLVSWPA